ncbi:hypothetical protein DITRI_Ditri18aG0098400 [Diplodiscus trichospermus]
MGRKPVPKDMPGFFKVLLGDFSKRLQIPPAFAKFFDQTPLPQKINLQNSEKCLSWQVDVVKIDKKLFFDKGWKAFVKDNLLELGDFVVVNYVGRSAFGFTIFGRNACEKDVTAVPRKSDGLVSGRGRKKKWRKMMKNQQTGEDRGSQRCEGRLFDNEKRHGKVSDNNGANRSGWKVNDQPVQIKIEETDDEEDDISVDFVEEIPNLGEKRKRTAFKASVPCTQTKGKEAGGSKVAPSVRAAGSQKSRGATGVKHTTQNCKQQKVLDKNVQKLTGKEKSLALQRSKRAFKSNNPFVMVAIQPSYIGIGRNKNNTNIPLEFVEAYFNKQHNNGILQLPGGKAWPVKYYVPKQTKQPAKLNGGWLAFAVDNNLAVGDVCVFELIDRTENILRVDIFRNMVKSK